MDAKSKNDLKSKSRTPNSETGKLQCTITKLFERQKLKSQESNAVETIVECPVCNLKVSERRINYHLDNECGIETTEKSPYFSNENHSSSGPRLQLPVRRKLSLSLGRKVPQMTTGISTEITAVGIASCPKDGARNVGLSKEVKKPAKEGSSGLPRKISLQPETVLVPDPPNKRLKISKNAPQVKSSKKNSPEAELSADTKISPIPACSNSTSPRPHSLMQLGNQRAYLTITSLTSPMKEPCSSSSLSSPIIDFETRNCCSDLKTPNKSVNTQPFTDSNDPSTHEKKCSNFERSKFSPFKSSYSCQSPSPRKQRFIQKIPTCFSEIKLQLSPKKFQLNQETTPKSSRLCPAQPALYNADEPENHFLAKYFPSPSSKGMSSSQDSNSGTLFYYLNNFLDILRDVLDVPDDLALFNEEDLQTVKQFYLLPDKCQELFVRLFTRKHHWFRKEKIKYPEIADDLESVLDELVNADFLEIDDNIHDLKTVLSLLPSASMKNLCKLLNLKVTTKKSEMMQGVLEHCSKQNGMFRTFGSTSKLEDVAIKKAKTLLGRCYHLRNEPRRIFVRILMLYSLTDSVDDGIQEDSPAQLTTMLLINMGRFVFPPYKVLRSTQIFRSRDDFLLYEKAVLLEGQILIAMESKMFAEALHLCNSALDCFNNLISRDDIISHDLGLPTFLRLFTAGQVFTRCVNHRVEVLQKRHEYESAVVQLHQLLEQDLYCQQYRGHWVERLALNLDQHLQQPCESFAIIENALVDARVTNSHKLALYQRAERIVGAKKHKKIMKNCLKNITKITVAKVAECHIEGKIISNNIPGYKSVFLYDEISSSGNDIDMVACSVEEFALSHYRKNNYPEGVHAEGSALVSLFGLLFWDIIYSPGIPDAFRSTHQFFPLDLNSSEFYRNRKIAIDSRIALLKCSSVEELNDRICQCWRSHEGQTSLIKWEMYRSFEFVQSLVLCIGSECLANICERFATNFRHFRSGVPDLTMWNTETKQWKMVEVKGPGDRLSHKQIFWLDYLHSIGVSVEVCYVKAIGSKKLRKSLPLDDTCKEN